MTDENTQAPLDAPVPGAGGDLAAATTATTVTTVTAPVTVLADTTPPPPPTSRWEAWRHFRRNYLAMVGLVIIVVLILTAIFADIIAPYSYEEINAADGRLGPFSGNHYFGTDKLGRDVFSQVVYGTRVSLRVGLIVAILSSALGIVFGAISGYLGGWVDNTIMRFVDIFLAIPYIILTVALVGIIGRGVNAVIVALSLSGWFVVARVVRASFLQLKEQEFVQAARALGYSRWRIMFRHILPNALQPVIVYTTLGIGSAILSEAALSFLAIGVLPPTPSWGLLVSENKGLMTQMPHLVFFPGAAIFVTVLAFVFVGDGLRDALDPKLRN